jgi:type I restriction enzyme S subunit
MANLNTSILSALPFVVPPFPEQHAIARFLGGLDAKIHLNWRTNGTLEAIARALFKAWFVDFEPIKAKAAGASGFRGMPGCAFAQLPNKFSETEYGPTPTGWKHVPIGNLVNVVGGGTPSTKNPEFWEAEGGHKFCTPKDMARLHSPVLLETERHITQAGVNTISSGLLPVGAVILSSRAPIGYLAVAATPVSVNQGIIAMITGEVPNVYVMLLIEANMSSIKARAGGSTFAEINKRNFRSLPALLPDGQILKAFGDIARPLFELIASNERESESLVAIRDALLPKLTSGEIRVTHHEVAHHEEVGDGR